MGGDTPGRLIGRRAVIGALGTVVAAAAISAGTQDGTGQRIHRSQAEGEWPMQTHDRGNAEFDRESAGPSEGAATVWTVDQDGGDDRRVSGQGVTLEGAAPAKTDTGPPTPTETGTPMPTGTDTPTVTGTGTPTITSSPTDKVAGSEGSGFGLTITIGGVLGGLAHYGADLVRGPDE